MPLCKYAEIFPFRIEGWKVDQGLVNVPTTIVALVNSYPETVARQAPLADGIPGGGQVIEKLNVRRVDIEGKVQVFIPQITFRETIALKRHLRT